MADQERAREQPPAYDPTRCSGAVIKLSDGGYSRGSKSFVTRGPGALV